VVENFPDSGERIEGLTLEAYKRVDDRISITFLLTELVYVTVELTGISSVTDWGWPRRSRPVVLLDGSPVPLDDLERRARTIRREGRELVVELIEPGGVPFFEAVARAVTVKRDIVEPPDDTPESIF
jgi:hypothetical protein